MVVSGRIPFIGGRNSILNTLITMVLAICLMAILYALFTRLKTPWYRVDAQKMLTTIERVLTGQASENQWAMTFSMTIRHDPELEMIRQRCCEIEERYAVSQGDYLFNREGLHALEGIREELLTLSEP